MKAPLRIKSGVSAEQDEVALLDQAYEKYIEVNRRIDQLTNQQYSHLGLDPTGGLTDDEVAQLLREASNCREKLE